MTRRGLDMDGYSEKFADGRVWVLPRHLIGTYNYINNNKYCLMYDK